MFTPLRISVHYTRATPTIPSVPSIPGLTLSPGRPRISKIIDHAVSKALSVGTRLDVSDAQQGDRPEKGRVGRSHSRRDQYTEKHGHHGSKEGRKLQVDVEMEEVIHGSREKEDIQDITGVIIGICGPAELGKDIVSAIGNVDGEKRNRVGGIEVHEE